MTEEVSNEVERVTLTEAQLFERLVKLELEKLTLTDDIKQLKLDASFHKKANPAGIPKEDVKLVQAAAKLEAQRDFEEKQEKANAVFSKYRELTSYDE